jgi:hypothetical protein
MTLTLKSLQRQSAPTLALALDRGCGDLEFNERDRVS